MKCASLESELLVEDAVRFKLVVDERKGEGGVAHLSAKLTKILHRIDYILQYARFGKFPYRCLF